MKLTPCILLKLFLDFSDSEHWSSNELILEHDSHGEQHCRELNMIARFISVLPSKYPVNYRMCSAEKIGYK